MSRQRTSVAQSYYNGRAGCCRTFDAQRLGQTRCLRSMPCGGRPQTHHPYQHQFPYRTFPLAGHPATARHQIGSTANCKRRFIIPRTLRKPDRMSKRTSMVVGLIEINDNPGTRSPSHTLLAPTRDNAADLSRHPTSVRRPQAVPTIRFEANVKCLLRQLEDELQALRSRLRLAIARQRFSV